jgi:hypothetical protein
VQRVIADFRRLEPQVSFIRCRCTTHAE